MIATGMRHRMMARRRRGGRRDVLRRAVVRRRPSGFRSVSDGEDALAYVRKEGRYADVATPDLIFLDLSLPKVSGLDVLKAIKSTPHLMHIPIVVASGSEDPEHVRAVYALNGNCFMRKPSDLPQFLRFVEMCYQFWGSVVTLSPPPRMTPESLNSQPVV